MKSTVSNGTRGKHIGTTDRVLTRIVTGTHRNLLNFTRWRFLNRMGGNTVGVLTTIGRRSGQPRRHPVITVPNDSDVLVVATNGGAATQPAWVHNLLANPSVELQLGTRTIHMKARILTQMEKTELWPNLVDAYPMYDKLARKTDRDIPVIRLTPVSTDR